MGNGTKESPYTREDVLRLIEQNGGKAEGLDLSGRVFEEGIDLSKRDLRGIILNKAVLKDAHLEGAVLWDANLEGTDLSDAHLKCAFLQDARFSAATRLETVDWGRKFIIGDEKEESRWGVRTYLRLKQWYTNTGLYDRAGEFYYREMEAKRKHWESWKPFNIERLKLEFFRFSCGYGERPWQVIRWGALFLLGPALMYFLLRGVAPYDLSIQAFLNSLYYSAVSFIALGYGPWFTDKSVHSWVQYSGVAEAFVGVFTVALFLVTFTRKMTR